MAKKDKQNYNGDGATELFFVVTMDNGKSSQALESRQDVLDWIDTNWVSIDPNDKKEMDRVNRVSQITVKRKRRRHVIFRLAELNTEITHLNKRLEFLQEQKKTLEGPESSGRVPL